MKEAIGIRLPKDVLRNIEKLGKEEMEDRSTIIRKLVMLGYISLIRKKSFEKYKREELTISEAADMAGLTIWEMEKYMVEQGFKSDYSLDDLKKELEKLHS